jgi:uncharacterized protein YbjT (DUF2867 family)
MSKKAIVLGASGLVGGELLKKLIGCNEFSSILVLSRKSTGVEHKKINEVVCDFNQLQIISAEITGDVLFCCIGTTRKKTPNLNEYRKIDVDIIKNVGGIAKNNGVRQAHLVSSVGANENSSNFYLKIKGEAEKQLKELEFQYVGLYRPAMLIGKRKERRLGEKFGQFVSPFFDLFMGQGKYHSIKAEMVANSMYWNAKNPMKGFRVLHYRDMIKLS